MCDPLSLLLGIGGGQIASSLKQTKAQIQPPEKPPQASKAPDRNAMLAANAGAAMPMGSLSGNSGTFLTGAGGIDPGTLNLGRNTLLGQ